MGSTTLTAQGFDSARATRLAGIAVVGLTLLALGLRLYCLDCWGLWYDEVLSLEVAEGGPGAIFANRFGWLGNQTPAYYLVLWLLTLVAEPTQTAMFVRLPSVLAGALAVPVVYLLGRDTLGRSTGLLAAVMLALSLPALNYSQDARPYSVTLLLTFIAFYSLMRILLGGWGKWWAVFAVATLTNMLHSYQAVTLALPPLALLAIWVLWFRWRGRERSGFSWAPPLIAATITGIAAVFSGLQALAIPGEPLDLSRITFGDALYVSFANLQWLLRAGLTDRLHIQFVLYLLPLGLLGLAGGIKAGGVSRYAVVSTLTLVMLPLAEVVLLTTSRLVLPRYLLFILPFVLMLVAHGAISLARLISSVPAKLGRNVTPAVVAVISAVLVLVFAMGPLRYYDPSSFAGTNTRPEFRGAASYLRATAGPGDLIVAASYPPHAFSVLDYYWEGSPPAPLYDAVDPTLYGLPSPRRMFVVVNSWGWGVPDRYFRDEQIDLRYPDGTGTAVLTLDGKGNSTMKMLRTLVEPLSNALAEDNMTLAFQGGLLQQDGDTMRAAEAYAQTWNPTPASGAWREYVAASEGFRARGDVDRAWRELLVAKYYSSAEPEVHRHLARALVSRGFHELAVQEERIAAELDVLLVTIKAATAEGD